MAAHGTYQLANGHTLTVVEVRRDELDAITRPAARDYFRVEERNAVGTALGVVFSDHDLGKCEAWVARAMERGYSLLTQGDSPELRVAAAELLILETYNVLRITQRFDFGCGQRYAELMRRRRELTGRNASRELLDAVAHADTGTFTPAELAQAWSNVGAPKLRRAESEREKYGSTGVVRTLEVWRRVARRFDKPTELPAEVEPAPFEYLACSCCGHVETRQADVEPPSRCEHCGAHHTALVNFGDLDAAEAFSEGLSY